MIRIIEVGPRDGLQNEKAVIPTERKVAFVNALSQSGVDEIEVSAFVSPKWIPQLSDAAIVFQRIERNPAIVYSALVPNEQGLDRALEARVGKVSVFTAASETFNRKNINASIAESIARFIPVVDRTKTAGLEVRGYISTSFWCPYEGRISPEKVIEVARMLVDLGVDELSIGDTIGKATAVEVDALLDLLLPLVPADQIAMHFHDTFGQALDNVAAAWRRGVTAFDASVGGLGGCPYAPGAPGNVATEAVVERLGAEGAQVKVDLDALKAATQLLRNSDT
jgi:hydroxymethylglutaryl-CoA lyase